MSLRGKTSLAFVALTVGLALQVDGEPIRFDIGNAHIELAESDHTMRASVRVGNRGFAIRSNLFGHLEENRRDIRFTSVPAEGWQTEKTCEGVRASCVSTLVTRPLTNRLVVGSAHISLDFREGRICLSTTVTPREPGRFRLRAGQPFQQEISLPEACWEGCEINTTDAIGVFRRTRFPSRAAFAPTSWGLNTGSHGSRVTELGFADFVLRFVAEKNASFRVNHYHGGFEHPFAYANMDRMHAPLWTRSLNWECSIVYAPQR